MARKSRKGLQNAEAPVTNFIYRTAIYARLSVVDSGKKDDGDTIENQKYIIEQYISEHDDLKHIATYTEMKIP